MNTRWMRAATAAVLVLLPILLMSSASADECPPLDIDCVAGDVVNQGGTAVEETVETVTGTADDTIDTVVGTIDDLDRPPIGDGGPALDGGSPGDRPNGDRDGTGRGITDKGPSGPRLASASVASSASARPFEPGFIGSGTTSIDLVGRQAEERGLAQRLAAVGAGAIKSLAVVLALLIAVGGFVLIQDRLDKKDPRLALAPMRSEVVRFT